MRRIKYVPITSSPLNLGHQEAGGLLMQKIQARYECYPDSKVIAQYLVTQLEQAGQIDCGAALREWASLPWSLFAQSWVAPSR